MMTQQTNVTDENKKKDEVLVGIETLRKMGVNNPEEGLVKKGSIFGGNKKPLVLS